MSLVLEALRRVEKTDTKAGRAGATVAPLHAPSRRGGGVFPLVLGMATGGLAIALFGPPMKDAAPPEPGSRAHTPTGRAGLPPPIFQTPSPVESPVVVRQDAAQRVARAQSLRVSPPASPRQSPPPPLVVGDQALRGLVLQGISVLDSHPVAVISDHLVKEGDALGTARVLTIGSESVELILENGVREILRFSPPPPPVPSPTSDPI